MLVILQRFSFLVLAVLMSSAHAAESTRFGWLPTVSYVDVGDPNGPAEIYTGLTYLSAVLLTDLGRDSRLFLHGHYDTFDLEASTSNIHQSVDRYGVNAVYQINLRITRAWKPWVGLGLGYSQDKITDRYILTPGGFTGARYPDRTEDSVIAVANVSSEWQFSRELDMGLHFQWEEPLSDGVRAVRVGLYIVY